MSEINPDNWPFERLVPVDEIEHQAFYDALDKMDQRLIVLAEEHQKDMEVLVADFYAQLEEIMQEYKDAIEFDVKRHTPWLLDKPNFIEHFNQGDDDNDNQ